MDELFHLAFLLTADIELAEQCMILVMRECLAGCVFKRWLPVWVRRMVVRTGIEIVLAKRNEPRGYLSLDRAVDPTSEPVDFEIAALNASAGILTLNELERLVYVLSMIERYPLRECALLLGSSTREVSVARTSAIRAIAAFECEMHSTSGTLSEEKLWTSSKRLGVDTDFACGTLLDEM
jgi:hypothetical protein